MKAMRTRIGMTAKTFVDFKNEHHTETAEHRTSCVIRSQYNQKTKGNKRI